MCRRIDWTDGLRGASTSVYSSNRAGVLGFPVHSDLETIHMIVLSSFPVLLLLLCSAASSCRCERFNLWQCIR